MNILVSGANSAVAYHLLPTLASGGVTGYQPVHLILCDIKENREDLLQLSDELKDCAFPCLDDVSITDNFCEACKSADIVLYLSRDLERGCHGNTTVEVCCNSLTDINFYGLGCALHPFQRYDSNEENVTFKNSSKILLFCPWVDMNHKKRKAHGPLSIAGAIIECIQQIYEQSVAKCSTVEVQDQSAIQGEAEFGCPPISDIEGYFSTCYKHINFQPNAYRHTTSVMFVTTNNGDEDDDYVLDNTKTQNLNMNYSMYLSKL